VTRERSRVVQGYVSWFQRVIATVRAPGHGGGSAVLKTADVVHKQQKASKKGSVASSSPRTAGRLGLN